MREGSGVGGVPYCACNMTLVDILAVARWQAKGGQKLLDSEISLHETGPIGGSTSKAGLLHGCGRRMLRRV